MRIKSKIQPLVFCFNNMDSLLEAMAKTEKESISLSLYKGRYYLTVHCGFRNRYPVLESICTLGSFKGLGMVLDAFIAEHGVRICHETKAGRCTKAN